MQTSLQSAQSVNLAATINAQLINTHMGWQIFLSRVFKHGSDKGLWLHWYHPVDQGRKDAVRYGYFIAPDQTLEDALHAVHQSIEAVVELESTEHGWFGSPGVNHSERYCQALPG